MPRRYFPGWTQKQLEDSLNLVLEDRASGRVSTSLGVGDFSRGMAIEQSAASRIQMLTHDLALLDPCAYSVADVTPIDRTQIVFK